MKSQRITNLSGIDRRTLWCLEPCWSHYKQSLHFIETAKWKKICKWVNICSRWASASPDSQTATRRGSRCGHNSESIGGEINCANLSLDNTMRGWWRRMKKRRWWEEKDRSRHLVRQKYDAASWQETLVCICANRSSPPLNDRQLGITSSYLTGKHPTARYLSLNAQEPHYVPADWPPQWSMTDLWVLSDFHYVTGVYGFIWTAYIRQPLCVRLHRTRRLAAAGETSAVSHQEDKFGHCGRARRASTIDLAGSGLMFGAMWVTGVKSACHRQLNSVLRHPTETPFSEQKCDRKLWTENRAQTEAAASQRGERPARCSLSCGDFISPSWK